MEQLTRKTFVNSRGLTYTYYHHTGNPDKPTLLLQHGFPEDHNLWSQVIPYLLQLPYPIVVPDLLGYNGTSKPTDASLYNSKSMADDLAEILDHEGIKNIVSVGHDWGAFLAQRMWLWHPDRVTGVILLNVAYHSPSATFDLDKLNELAIKMTGLPRHSYWYLFTAPDGAQVLRDHIESLWAACHGNPENWLETLFCHPGAMEDFLRSDKLVPLKPYAEDPKLKDGWIARHEKDGFQGPVNWYIAQTEGHHWAVEKELPKERFPMTVPVLFIGASEDTVCRTEAIYAPQKAGLLPDLTIKEIKSGHWQTLEVPDQTGPLMAEWLKEKEGVLSKAKV